MILKNVTNPVVKKEGRRNKNFQNQQLIIIFFAKE